MHGRLSVSHSHTNPNRALTHQNPAGLPGTCIQLFSSLQAPALLPSHRHQELGQEPGADSLRTQPPLLVTARSRAVAALQVPQHFAGRLCYLATCSGERRETLRQRHQQRSKLEFGSPQIPPAQQPCSCMPSSWHGALQTPLPHHGHGPHGSGGFCCPLHGLGVLGLLAKAFRELQDTPLPQFLMSSGDIHRAGGPNVSKSLLPKESRSCEAGRCSGRVELHLETCSGAGAGAWEGTPGTGAQEPRHCCLPRAKLSRALHALRWLRQYLYAWPPYSVGAESSVPQPCHVSSPWAALHPGAVGPCSPSAHHPLTKHPQASSACRTSKRLCWAWETATLAHAACGEGRM